MFLIEDGSHPDDYRIIQHEHVPENRRVADAFSFVATKQYAERGDGIRHDRDSLLVLENDVNLFFGMDDSISP
jgi:hypothetical protein